MSREYNLSTLTPESTLLFFLRTLFETAAEYAVYIPDSGDVIVLNKGQLVALVERNCADAMIKTLPQLAGRGIFRPLNPENIEYPEDASALYVKTTGSFISNLETALDPDEPQYPKWWDAPVPFAICSRGVLRINEKAKELFGSGLEKLNAEELPKRDEFIVRLEGLNDARFIAFRKLQPGIFTIDDCTEDLNDAQDITWWAAVGHAWIKEIEAHGGKWQRLNNPPEGKKVFRVCEWQGEVQGYLNIEMPPRKKATTKKNTAPAEIKNPPPQMPQKTEENKNISLSKNSDDVIGSIGPQAMALLAAGQSRERESEGSFVL